MGKFFYYLTDLELQRLASENVETETVRKNLALSHTTLTHLSQRILICHSPDDARLVEPARVLFALQGVDMVIDWQGAEEAGRSSYEVASLLKHKLDACTKLVVLVSSQAGESPWPGWALGYADGHKGLNRIAVLPLADSGSEWDGAAYLSLYPTIMKAPDDQLAVFQPAQKDGTYLRDWLRK